MTRFRVCAAIVFLVISFPALAASPGPTTPPQMINENQRVVLQDSVHQLARPEFDRGPAVRDLTMQKMVLVLRLRPEAERERDALLAQLSDPSSPYYHQRLTPEEYGLRFGVTDQDLDLVLQG